MKTHWGYLKYVVRHKWFVLLASFETGVPWLGLLHDLSKFRPDEWRPYAHYFYGRNKDENQAGEGRDNTGYYKPYNTGDDRFDYAWLLHQKRNKHHWQWWVLPNDNGSLKVLEMPEKYMREALADWYGAGKAQAKPENPHRGWIQVEEWWIANHARMNMHEDSLRWFGWEVQERATRQREMQRIRTLVP